MARKSAGGTAAQVMARVNHQMKANVLTMANDPHYELSRVPTGSLTMDRLLNGGFARGRHVELYGDWMVAKSLIAYRTLALAQERGEVCALVDGESVFNAQFFKKLGGDPDKLIIYRPHDANELGNVLQLFIQRNEAVEGVSIVLIDSVASMLPKEELEHDFEAGDARVGSLARLMSLLLRKVTTQNDETLFIWTNQWRDKISRIPGLKSTPGGHALAFYASTRVEMTQNEKETEDRKVFLKGKEVQRKVAVGRWVQCKLVKDKTGARPETVKQFLLNFDLRMPDEARELIDLGMEDGFIERHGDTYHVIGYDEEVKAHGLKKMVTKINDDEELRDFLRTCVEEQTFALAEETVE